MHVTHPLRYGKLRRRNFVMLGTNWDINYLPEMARFGNPLDAHVPHFSPAACNRLPGDLRAAAVTDGSGPPVGAGRPPVLRMITFVRRDSMETHITKGSPVDCTTWPQK
jgi:hypothetical protein